MGLGGQLWSCAWPQTVGEEGGRAVKAVGLWGERAGGGMLSFGPVAAKPLGGWWQGLGEEKEHEMICEV